MTLRLSASLSAAGEPGRLRRDARLADRAGLDFLMLEDPADALIGASWLIPLTVRLGLVPWVHTTYGHPFHTARSLAAMDTLSGGRLGWLPTCQAYADLSAAFGADDVLAGSIAIDKTAEYIAAAQSLWDSWDGDALIINKDSAIYLNSAKIRRIDFRGNFFRIMGPLNAARPPQGYPVLFQDDSHPGFDRMRLNADVLLVGAATPDEAQVRVASLRSLGAPRILVKACCGSRHEAGAALHAAGDVGRILDLLAHWQSTLACDGMHLTCAADGGRLTQLLQMLCEKTAYHDQPPRGTLRARLGAPLPRNRFSAT